MKDFEADWVDTNNRAIRQQRTRRVLGMIAVGLVIICIAIAAMIILNAVLASAAAKAAIAPVMMRF